MMPETLSPSQGARAARVQGRRRMSLEAFQKWKPHDGWKYDWDHGVASRSCRMTTEEQRHIVRNLLRAFSQTADYANGGYLLPEAEVHTAPDQVRVPDIAYFTTAHDAALRRGERLFPSWLVEVVSKNDTGLTYMRKLKEYFQAGAKVVWLVYPDLDLVYVYHSETQVKIVAGQGTCKAAPAVDFSIAVEGMLRP